MLLRSLLVGFYGYAAFCFVLALGLESLGGPAAFSAAVLAAVVVQGAIAGISGRWRLAPAERL